LSTVSFFFKSFVCVKNTKTHIHTHSCTHTHTHTHKHTKTHTQIHSCTHTGESIDGFHISLSCRAGFAVRASSITVMVSVPHTHTHTHTHRPQNSTCTNPQ